MDTKSKSIKNNIALKIIAYVVAFVTFAVFSFNIIDFGMSGAVVGFARYVSGGEFTFAEMKSVQDEFNHIEDIAATLAQTGSEADRKMYADEKSNVISEAMDQYKDIHQSIESDISDAGGLTASADENSAVFWDENNEVYYDVLDNLDAVEVDYTFSDGSSYVFSFPLSGTIENYKKSYDEIQTIFEEQYDETVESLIKADTYEEGTTEDALSQYVNIGFYVVNDDGSVVTNLKSKPIASDMKTASLSSSAEFDSGGEYTVYLVNRSEIKDGDSFSTYRTVYDRVAGSSSRAFMQLVVSLVMLVLLIWSLILIATFAGYRKGEEEPHILTIDRFFPNFHFILSSVLFFVPYGLVLWYVAAKYYNYVSVSSVETGMNSSEYMVLLGGLTAAGVVSMAIFLEWLTSTARIVKTHRGYWKNMFIVKFAVALWHLLVKICRWIGKVLKKIIGWPVKKLGKALSYKPKHFGRNITIMFIIVVAVNIIFAMIGSQSWIGFIGMLVVDAFVFYKVITYVRDLEAVIDASGKMEDVTFPSGKPEKSLETLAHNVSVSNEHMREAVGQAVKDERFKTELITNVSHDLKTPLTSVINYTDLLSKCDIQDEAAQEYIGVLQTQATKLKRLIEDLIEASKVSTGNVTLHRTTISLSELVAQTSAEFAPELEKNGNTIIVTDNDKPVAFADGQKTCRILSNLFSNIKKYAAPDTRVYIDLYSESDPAPGYSFISVKNVSAKQLNITPEELTERFVRGDRSRGETEGNGLGLSIAKDLCSLQDGELILEIDGDLFKATVKLPMTEPAPKEPPKEK